MHVYLDYLPTCVGKLTLPLEMVFDLLYRHLIQKLNSVVFYVDIALHKRKHLHLSCSLELHC